MIDFNSDQFQDEEIVIFNGGKAGLAENVDLTIRKKSSTDHQNAPDYTLVAIDDKGGEVKQGYYYTPASDSASSEDIEKHQINTIRRLITIVKKMVPADFKLPSAPSYKEGIDLFAGLIREHSQGKKFNVFATYGTNDYPRAFLELRYFNCVAREGETLIAGARDLMVRLEPDNESTTNSGVDSVQSDSDWFN